VSATLFSGNQPGPIAVNLKKLSAAIKNPGKGRAGHDGDADRIGILDEKGQLSHPARVYALLALYLLETAARAG